MAPFLTSYRRISAILSDSLKSGDSSSQGNNYFSLKWTALAAARLLESFSLGYRKAREFLSISGMDIHIDHYKAISPKGRTILFMGEWLIAFVHRFAAYER